MTIDVVVEEAEKKVKAIALLDFESSCSFLTEKLATNINLSGPSVLAETAVLENKVFSNTHRQVSVKQHRTDAKMSTMEAFVMYMITPEAEPVDWNIEKQCWPHLKNPFSLAAQEIDFLIGLNAPELHATKEECCGREEESMARLTSLGWVCFSALPTTVDNSKMCATIILQPENDSNSSKLSTSNMARKLFELEMGQSRQEWTLSMEEWEVERQTAASLCTDDGRFTMGNPWRNSDGSDVAANQKMATRRLESLQLSLKRWTDMASTY